MWLDTADPPEMHQVDVVGKWFMPDGKALLQVRTVDGSRTWWVDEDLGILEGDD
jgi:hypothetical protein